MSAPTNDGGPAYPCPDDYTQEGSPIYGPKNLQGMTLRDFFAAQVLAATDPTEHTSQVLAQWAYETADAMLAAREGRAE